MSSASLLLIIPPLFFFTHCEKKNKGDINTVYKNSTTTAIMKHSDDEEYKNIEDIDPDYIPLNNMDQILSVIDFKVGDHIKLDSPKRFIQISILFTLAQSKNYYGVSQKNKNDNQISDYMNKQRANFYQKLGISEDTYIQYGIKHRQEISTFLDENPEFEEAYNITMSQITE